MKYVKRNKSSFDDFSVQHTPCATLDIIVMGRKT